MSETIDILMELLNEYQESECAIAEDRVTWYADRLDGRTEDEQMDERTRTEQNGVGITDELREYVDQKDGWGMTHTHAKAIAAIADSIDERYHRDMATAQQVGINEGEDAAMRDGWVRLPVDADGEVIHRGDVMVKPDGYDNRLFIVNGMTLYGDQWSVQGFAPHNLRHDHPTVEDVLEELLREYDRDDSELTNGEIIERFAAKLRLAGDDE